MRGDIPCDVQILRKKHEILGQNSGWHGRNKEVKTDQVWSWM